MSLIMDRAGLRSEAAEVDWAVLERLGVDFLAELDITKVILVKQFTELSLPIPPPFVHFHLTTYTIDFNAHFTSCTVWQAEELLSRQVDNLFVKETDEGLTMAQTLATRFVTEYFTHRKKRVTLTGDRNGKNKSAGSTESMFDQFASILRANDWLVIVSPLNYNPPHKDKFVLISDVLSEQRPDLLRVRLDGIKCKATILSIENSPLKPDYSKDKGSESSSMEQERATHLSDTVDYYIIWKLKGGSTTSYNDFDISLL
jgi:hypothetical protein